MPAIKKRFSSLFMIAAYLKEASHGAGVVMDASNATSSKKFTLEYEIADVMDNDKEEISGSEHGTTQEIIEFMTNFTFSEASLKSNSLAWVVALVLGNTAATKDGAFDAYRHKNIPVVPGVALPTTQLEFKIGDEQKKCLGVFGKSFTLTGEEKKPWAIEAALSGDKRPDSATAFVAALTENTLLTNKTSVFIDVSANKSITDPPVQGAQNISSGTPVTLNARIISSTIVWDSVTEGQTGYGADGSFQGVDIGPRRVGTIVMKLRYNDNVEPNYYFNQDKLVIELNCKNSNTEIDAGGAMFPGFIAILPTVILNKDASPRGDGNLEVELSGDIYDDGTNPAIMFWVYTSQAAYFA